MNRRVFAAVLAGLLLCAVLVLPLRGALGFGDFDSDSDFGGSDYGGSDYGGSDYGSDYGDSDYSYRDGKSRSRNSSSGDAFGGFMAIVLMMGIGLFAAATKSGNSGGSRSGGSGGGSGSIPRRKPEINRIPMETEAYKALRERDPGYSEEALFEYIKKLFREMQDGWEAGDITNVQYGFLPDTWQRFSTQLMMKNRRGETTHVRDIVFGSIKVTGFRPLPNEGRDKLQVTFQVTYNVWTTNKDGNNIQGSPETRHLMTYLWTMERPHSAETQKVSADTSHCPNCGAELDVAAFAECPFCHTQLRTEAVNWVIRDIRAEAQRTI